MRLQAKLALVAILVAASLVPAAAHGEPCEQAWKHLDAVRDWDQLRRHRSRFPRCDDGALAQCYSEFVVHTLATRWHTLGRLQALTNKEPGFRRFVLDHIDATTDERELAAVRRYARDRSPKGAEALCRAIADRAGRALEDIKKARQRERTFPL